jgi:hypothetical protein
MDDFRTVRLKKKTLSRFKSFSRKVTGSYSKTLDTVMNFFEWHGFLPSDRFERSIVQEIVKNRKRTEASIAIIKNIEKDQTRPTNAMLLSLFEEKVVQDAPELVERKFVDTRSVENPIEATTVPKIRYERLEDKMNLVKRDLAYVLERVKTVKSGFGKGYLKLELSEEELIKLKRTLKNP